MASSLQRKLNEKHLKCPICMDMCTDPRVLPCLHTFCFTCLHAFITRIRDKADDIKEKAEDIKETFECPVCRSDTQWPLMGLHQYSWTENHPPNFAERGLITKTQDEPAKEDYTVNGNNQHINQTNVNEKLVNEAKTTCESHPDRIVEFVCEDHRAIICSICATQQHRICEHVNYLDDDEGENKSTFSDRTVSSDVLSRKHRSLSRISRSMTLPPNKDEKKSSLPIDPKVLTEEFAQARVIDKLAEGETSKTPKKETVSNKFLRRLFGDNKHNISEDVSKPARYNNELNIETDIQNLQHTTHTDMREHFIHSLEPPANQYQNDINLNLSVRSLERHGTLNDILEEDEEPKTSRPETNISKSQLMLHGEYYIRIQTDNVCCSITGVTSMPDGRILLVDENNKNIKMFDSEGRYITHLDLPSEPWDIDAIEQCEAVITFPSEKCIRTVVIDEHVSIVRTINVDKQCFGVAYHNHEFWVAMETEVRLITYDGVTLTKINRDSSKKKFFSISTPKNLFTGAHYLKVDPESKNTVYVSDCARGCIVSLDRKGNAISTIRTSDDKVKTLGLSIGPNGKVFVCQWPKSLVVVSTDEHGSRIKHLLELENIQSVHFVRVNQKLWITRSMNNFINVYMIKNDII